MSTTPSSSPKPKPERSFSLTKIRASLRRSSKGASESSPEASEGRPSIDTPPTSPPATATTTPGSPTPAGSQRKPSSLRRMSLDVVRPNRHGRSGSVSMVPPADSATSSNGAVAASGAAPATNGSTEKGADFDPFSESHDDKSKPRGWRKTMKGALRRTTSRLSTSSAHSGGKPPSIENKEGAEVAPALESPPVLSTDSSTKQEEAAPVSKDVPDAVADAKPTEEATKEEDKDEAKDAAPAVPLEASTSLEWEHVDTKDADSPSVSAAPAVEVTPSAEPEDEDAAEAKNLPPLNVSSRHMMHLRSEMAELSPIIESPITAVRDDGDVGLAIPQHSAAKAPSPLRSAIEESYVEIPHLNEVAEAAENADVANAAHRSGGPIVVNVTPATLKPTTSATSDVTASPALNAIELGNGIDGDKKPTATTPLLANRSTSTSSANAQESTDTQQQANASALGFVSNTAWFVGACVVLGIGMVVGQVRSYRQVQRRSSSAISSYFMTVKRWLRLA